MKLDKKLSASGGFPLSPHQGLCPRTPVIGSLAMVHPLWQILDPPLTTTTTNHAHVTVTMKVCRTRPDLFNIVFDSLTEPAETCLSSGSSHIQGSDYT